MELIEILNKNIPNAGPQARAAIAEAERRLTMLDGTDPKRAAILREQVSQQISSRDEGVKFTLADIGRLHGSSLSRVEPQEKVSEEKQNVAKSIEQLISIADSRNISIPPAVLNDAANAFVSKDVNSISLLANSIGELVDAGIKVQQDEQKSPVRFDDGSIMLVGSQSGTRYDNTGTPIPSSNRNTQLFVSSASEAYSPRFKEIMLGTGGGGSDLVGAGVIGAPMQKDINIGANPEAYISMQAPAPTSIEEKEQARKKVRNLYFSGDKIGALDLLNAAGGKGLLGGDYTIADLDDLYKDEVKPPSKDEVKPPANDTRVPLDKIPTTR